MSKGRFVLVTGPSGAGKDSLIAFARQELEFDPRFVFPKRVVTRTAVANAEDHDSLSETDFATEQARGAFCLNWQAHGLAYGIPAAVGQHVADGSIAICNVSRTVLQQAMAVDAGNICVTVTAQPEVLLKRIIERGRESEIEARLRIARSTPPPPEGMENWIIDNSGDLETAGLDFVARLQHLT